MHASDLISGHTYFHPKFGSMKFMEATPLENPASFLFSMGEQNIYLPVQELANVLMEKPKDGEHGMKFDGMKRLWNLLPWVEVGQIVDVLTDGAKKYTPNNWMTVPDSRDRYFAALMRHMTAWYSGEIKDPDSRRSHLAHAGCCLLFLMWGDNNPEKRKSITHG